MLPTLWMLFGFVCSSPNAEDCHPILHRQLFESVEACNAAVNDFAHKGAADQQWGTVACQQVSLPMKQPTAGTNHTSGASAYNRAAAPPPLLISSQGERN